MSSVIEPLEYIELKALADRWSPWSVKRRLVCMVSWKPAKEQKVFAEVLGRMAKALEGEKVMLTSVGQGEKEKQKTYDDLLLPLPCLFFRSLSLSLSLLF